MSRSRVAVLVSVSVVLLAALVVGVFALRERTEDAVLRRYVARVAAPSRSLYTSWNTFQASIGRPEGSDELAVKASYDAATQLRDILDDIEPPPVARLFHNEMTDIAANVLKVIDARVTLALSGPQPDESGVIRDPEQQKRKIQYEAGNAFYVVKQTFPDAMAQLRTLERVARG